MLKKSRESKKVVVLHEYGPASVLTYEDVEAPKPTEGSVLVRVCTTSINPADWMVRSDAVKDILPVAFPHIHGCDRAGTVLEVGEGVTGFEPGDRVMAVTLHTYAELCTVKATDLVKFPDGLEMTTAATLPLVTITGDQLIRLGANVPPGQTVLITDALGAVGRSAVFAASQIGDWVIAGVRGKRLDAARQLPEVSEAIAIDDDTAIDRLGHSTASPTPSVGSSPTSSLPKSSLVAHSAASQSEIRKTLRFILPSTSISFSRKSTPQRPCTTLKRYATAS